MVRSGRSGRRADLELWTRGAGDRRRHCRGGPEIPGSPQISSLSWEELARDLRLAAHWCDQILIHGLEGCDWQDYPGRLRSFDWTDTAAPRNEPCSRGPSHVPAGGPESRRPPVGNAGYRIGLLLDGHAFWPAGMPVVNHS